MRGRRSKVIHFQNNVYVCGDKMFFQHEVQALTAKRLVSTMVQTTATVRDSLFGFRELTCIPLDFFYGMQMSPSKISVGSTPMEVDARKAVDFPEGNSFSKQCICV